MRQEIKNALSEALRKFFDDCSGEYSMDFAGSDAAMHLADLVLCALIDDGLTIPELLDIIKAKE